MLPQEISRVFLVKSIITTINSGLIVGARGDHARKQESHNGESEHLSVRRDRIGNNYPSRASPSECEAITQCAITISARARSRGYEAPSAIVVSRTSIYRDPRSALDRRRRSDLYTLGTLSASPRALDFALDKFIPSIVDSRSAE